MPLDSESLNVEVVAVLQVVPSDDKGLILGRGLGHTYVRVGSKLSILVLFSLVSGQREYVFQCMHLSVTFPTAPRTIEITKRNILLVGLNTSLSRFNSWRDGGAFQTSSESAFRFTSDSARTVYRIKPQRDRVVSLLRNSSHNHRRSWPVFKFSKGALTSLVISAFTASNKASKSKLAK